MATRAKPYATELSAFMSDFAAKHGRRPGATEVHKWWSTAKNASGIGASYPGPKPPPPKSLPTPKPGATFPGPKPPWDEGKTVTRRRIQKLPRMAKGGIIRAKAAPHGRPAPRNRPAPRGRGKRR